MSPQRIQRRRMKGWRMPAGAVYVGRPSKWGNPYGFTHHPDGVVVHWGPEGRHCSFPRPTLTASTGHAVSSSGCSSASSSSSGT